MSDYINILWEFRFIIILVVAILLFAVFEWEKFKGILYALMLQGKRYAKDKVLHSGKAQEEWVLIQAYAYLPRWITLFIPQEVMRRIIKYLYDKAKDYLDDGVINDSVGKFED